MIHRLLMDIVYYTLKGPFHFVLFFSFCPNSVRAPCVFHFKMKSFKATYKFVVYSPITVLLFVILLKAISSVASINDKHDLTKPQRSQPNPCKALNAISAFVQDINTHFNQLSCNSTSISLSHTHTRNYFVSGKLGEDTSADNNGGSQCWR